MEKIAELSSASRSASSQVGRKLATVALRAAAQARIAERFTERTVVQVLDHAYQSAMHEQG
jgi:hypothetical protein